MKKNRTQKWKRKHIDLGFHHMVIYNVDLEKWCKEYDLAPFKAKCMDCDSLLEVIVPFAGKNRRGLRAEPCACGNYDVPFTYIDINYDCINLNSLAGTIENSIPQASAEKTQKDPPFLRLV
jgi:hypothetical protein